MAATQKPLSFSLGPLNTKYILDLVAAQKLINSRYNRSIYMDDLITHLRTKAETKETVKAKTELVSDKKYIPMFDHFWDMYDKKKARPKCEGLWKKLTGKELELIFNNLPNYVLSTPNKQFRSNPETWLRNKGWNDEVITNERHEKNTPTLSAYERQVKRNDELYRQPNECELGVGAASGHLGGAVDEGAGRATIEHVDTGTFVDYE